MITICASLKKFFRVVNGLLPENPSTDSAPNCAGTPEPQMARPGGSNCWGKIPLDAGECQARCGVAALGSWESDLNCGCPSKTVKNSGETLLKDPELIDQAEKAIRAGVRADLPFRSRFALAGILPSAAWKLPMRWSRPARAKLRYTAAPKNRAIGSNVSTGRPLRRSAGVYAFSSLLMVKS